MDIIFNKRKLNVPVEHIFLKTDLYFTNHPENGNKVKLTECFVDPKDPLTPLYKVCSHQSNCTDCLSGKWPVKPDQDSCVYGKYASYPTEYFIL